MSKKQSGLGRDFYSLLDDNIIESKGETNTELRIADIEPRSDQPRKDFDQQQLQSLADSIAEHGVLQPIIVRENVNAPGTYEIIAGERRWRASKMAGLTMIPAVIVTGDDMKVAQVSLIENLQRQDLNPVEEALAYSALMERFSMTQEQVAKQAGKSRSAVANMLRLLDLPDEILILLKNGTLSTGHARAILGLNAAEDMIPVAQKVIAKDLSVRDTEHLVRFYNNKSGHDEEDEETPATQKNVYMKEIESRAMKSLGRKIRIHMTNRKKTVELTFDSDEDLEALLRQICGDDIFPDSEES